MRNIQLDGVGRQVGGQRAQAAPGAVHGHGVGDLPVAVHLQPVAAARAVGARRTDVAAASVQLRDQTVQYSTKYINGKKKHSSHRCGDA